MSWLEHRHAHLNLDLLCDLDAHYQADHIPYTYIYAYIHAYIYTYIYAYIYRRLYNIRHHTTYVIIRMHTSAYVTGRWLAWGDIYMPLLLNPRGGYHI